MTFASKIFSGLLAFVMFHSPAFGFGGNNGESDKPDEKIVTVTVATDGSGDYATLEEARDYVRTLDKTKYDGIDIVVGAGEYTLSEAFTLTEEDSGTETCPVRYIGEDGAHLYGGVAFTAADFEPLGDGEVVQYFPEDVKDKLVQIDLKQFGFKPEEVRQMVWFGHSGHANSYLYCDGEKMTVARFPNDVPGTTDGWARIKYGHVEVEDGVELGDIKNYKDVVTTIEFDEAYNERVHSWHDIYDGFINGRFTYLWFLDNYYVRALDPEKPVMQVQYSACGYEPREGMVFYWYHIPEELDVPGEYYIDKDCVLYYYPTDAHETAVYTMPHLNDSIITLDNVQYLTIDNLSIEASRRDGIRGEGSHITVQNSTVQGVNGCGIRLHGSNITIQNNTLNNLGQSGIAVTGGDEATLTRADNLVTNNYVANWSAALGVMESGIRGSGCGLTISHNEVCHSVDWGIGFSGAYITCEYNHLYNLGRFQDDGAAIHITQSFGSVIRYNYINGIGLTDKSLHFVGVNGFNLDFPFGDVDIYGNVVCDITGYGLLCQRRGFRYHDNLLISCYMGGYYGASWLEDEVDVFESMYGLDLDVPEYMLSETWLEAFPFIGDMKFVSDGAEIEMENPNWWGNAAGSVIKNNFMYIDRANTDPRFNGGMGTYKVWYGTEKFADITYPTADEVVIYSSSRGRGHPDIREAIERASGTINLPYEEFEKIGRVK